MRNRIVMFISCLMLFVSCKNDNKEPLNNAENDMSTSYSQNDGLITLKGDFIYDETQNAAVIQTPNQIYGVVVDANMKALNKQVRGFKKEATDMIPVTVRAKKIAKLDSEEGWPFRLEIKQIIKVEAPHPSTNDIIKLEN